MAPAYDVLDHIRTVVAVGLNIPPSHDFSRSVNLMK